MSRHGTAPSKGEKLRLCNLSSIHDEPRDPGKVFLFFPSELPFLHRGNNDIHTRGIVLETTIPAR